MKFKQANRSFPAHPFRYTKHLPFTKPGQWRIVHNKLLDASDLSYVKSIKNDPRKKVKAKAVPPQRMNLKYVQTLDKLPAGARMVHYRNHPKLQRTYGYGHTFMTPRRFINNQAPRIGSAGTQTSVSNSNTIIAAVLNDDEESSFRPRSRSISALTVPTNFNSDGPVLRHYIGEENRVGGPGAERSVTSSKIRLAQSKEHIDSVKKLKGETIALLMGESVKTPKSLIPSERSKNTGATMVPNLAYNRNSMAPAATRTASQWSGGEWVTRTAGEVMSLHAGLAGVPAAAVPQRGPRRQLAMGSPQPLPAGSPNFYGAPFSPNNNPQQTPHQVSRGVALLSNILDSKFSNL